MIGFFHQSRADAAVRFGAVNLQRDQVPDQFARRIDGWKDLLIPDS
jgi:hypothetical protein